MFLLAWISNSLIRAWGGDNPPSYWLVPNLLRLTLQLQQQNSRFITV